MRRLPRDPIRFDVINVFAEFGRRERISLRGAAAADGFVDRARASINHSLSNEAFLHGLRTEVMFESLVASLGDVRILKTEDSGEVYVSDEDMKVPDFRLVLADGSQILVEVKNFFQKHDPRQNFQLDEDYLEGLIRYSTVMNCGLRLAVYWAKWNIWTLVKPDVFTRQSGKRVLDMLDALKVNQMAVIGDYTIGTRFPLSLVMNADQTKPRQLEADGTGTFTISEVDVRCGGKVITDPIEQRIATNLMFYGKWTYETEPHVIGNEIVSVEHRWVPEHDNKQGFEIVASLSEMFSTFYKFATEDEGRMEKLRLDITPGSMGSLIPQDHKGKDLPLWRFKQQASSAEISAATLVAPENEPPSQS